MNKNIIMRIISLVSVICTLCIIFIWEPDKTGDKYNYEENEIIDEPIVNSYEFENEEIKRGEDNKEIDLLIEELSYEEKELFDVIVNKLSVTDIDTINKIIAENNNSYGISEVLAFLEIRLLEEDYNKIGNIFIKEVDFIEEINVES